MMVRHSGTARIKGGTGHAERARDDQEAQHEADWSYILAAA